MRILIRGGTVVTATGASRADVLVDGETIAALLDPAHTGSFAGLADRSIDATGKYVIPGGIDVHTHLDMPFGGTFSADDFETGTRAAAWGGTTSLVDFAVQAKGASLRETLDAWHAKAEGKASIDYGFHMIVSDVNEQTLKEMDVLVGEGVTSFKMFMAYPGVFYAAGRQQRRDDHDARGERHRDRCARRAGAGQRAHRSGLARPHQAARDGR